MTQTLQHLHNTAAKARGAFEASVPAKFPGMDHRHWSRACSAMRNENVRRNDDQSHDAALAADPDIRAAHDAYIRAIHAYYSARDGDKGFLGARGA